MLTGQLLGSTSESCNHLQSLWTSGLPIYISVNSQYRLLGANIVSSRWDMLDRHLMAFFSLWRRTATFLNDLVFGIVGFVKMKMKPSTMTCSPCLGLLGSGPGYNERRRLL